MLQVKQSVLVVPEVLQGVFQQLRLFAPGLTDQSQELGFDGIKGLGKEDVQKCMAIGQFAEGRVNRTGNMETIQDGYLRQVEQVKAVFYPGRPITAHHQTFGLVELKITIGQFT
jgi:hypothetical protein